MKNNISLDAENEQLERVETRCDNTKKTMVRVAILFAIAYILEITMFALGLIPLLMFLICTGSFTMGLVIVLAEIKDSKFKIVFKNDEIIIDDLKKLKHYNFYNIKRNDFVCKQSKKQKESDKGFVKILSKKITFADIENYSAVMAHIDKYFKE